MIRRTPRSTRTDTLVPYTTLFRSKRGFLLTRALTVAMLMSVGLPLPARAQFGGIVYDPSNYAQNVLTAARSLQAVNNQIRQIENQAQSLINQAKNLTSLPVSTLSTLQIGRAHV